MRRGRLAPIVILMAATLMSACQRGSGGPLKPIEGAGVAVGADNIALAGNGALSARVSGRWASDGAQSMRISYRNGGSTPKQVALAGLKMKHASGDAVLWTAVDATGIDLNDARTDNDRPRVLYSLEDHRGGSAILRLPPGATRDLDLEFTSFSNEKSVAPGDRIVAMVPLGDRSADIAFTAVKAPLSPF